MGSFLWLNEVPVTVTKQVVYPYLQSPAEREVEREQKGSQVMKTV